MVLALALVVLGCAPASAPCDLRAECLPGFACVDGDCIPIDADFGCAANGCVVEGPDRSRLEVPAGALVGTVPIVIAPATTATTGIDALSAVFLIEPTDTTFGVPAVVRIRVAPHFVVRDTEVAAFASEDATSWRQLGGTSTSIEAVGSSTRLGYFAAGRI